MSLAESSRVGEGDGAGQDVPRVNRANASSVDKRGRGVPALSEHDRLHYGYGYSCEANSVASSNASSDDSWKEGDDSDDESYDPWCAIALARINRAEAEIEASQEFATSPEQDGSKSGSSIWDPGQQCNTCDAIIGPDDYCLECAGDYYNGEVETWDDSDDDDGGRDDKDNEFKVHTSQSQMKHRMRNDATAAMRTETAGGPAAENESEVGTEIMEVMTAGTLVKRHLMTLGHTLSASPASWLPKGTGRSDYLNSRLSVAAAEWLPANRAEAVSQILSASAAPWQPSGEMSDERRRAAMTAESQLPRALMTTGFTLSASAVPWLPARQSKGNDDSDTVTDVIGRRVLTKVEMAYVAELAVGIMTTRSHPNGSEGVEWDWSNNSQVPFGSGSATEANELNVNTSCHSLHPGLYAKRAMHFHPQVKQKKTVRKKVKAVPTKKLVGEAKPRASLKAYCSGRAAKARTKRASERASLGRPWRSCHRLDRWSLDKLDMCLNTSLVSWDPISRFLMDDVTCIRRVIDHEIHEENKSQIVTTQNLLPPSPNPTSATPLPHNQSGGL